MAQQIQRQTAGEPATDPLAGTVLGRHLVELLALTLDRSSEMEP